MRWVTLGVTLGGHSLRYRATMVFGGGRAQTWRVSPSQISQAVDANCLRERCLLRRRSKRRAYAVVWRRCLVLKKAACTTSTL